MLMELKILVKQETNDIINFKKIIIDARKIESVEQADNGFIVEEEFCTMNTDSGDTFLISMPYEHMIKYWHDSLETFNGLFISRVKEDNPEMN